MPTSPSPRPPHISFRLLTFLYQLLGFCPTAIESRTDDVVVDNPIRTLPTVVHLALATAQLGVVTLLHDVLFSAPDIFSRINGTMRSIGAAFAYVTICVESLAQRHRHSQFWQRCVRLQCSERDPLAAPPPLRVDRKLLAQLGAFLAMVALVELALWPIHAHHGQSTGFRLMYGWPVLVSRLRHWQFVHYVGHVESELRLIAAHLERVARADARDGSVCDRLRWSQRQYGALYAMAQDVNAMFGWSQLANCLQSYVQLQADMYWVYWQIYDGRAFPVLQYVTCLVPTLVITVHVFRTANRCMLQANRISAHLHCIQQATGNWTLAVLLETFSLQIRHQPIEFDAKGFFLMNYDPLRDMIGAITTLMVFFIQFTPKLKSLFKGE